LTDIKLNGEMKKMAETKYGKYFITGPQPWYMDSPGPTVVEVDGTHMKGSYFYFIHWVLRAPTGISGLNAWGEISHGPHIHKDAELLFHVGTNPDDPMDLGGVIELCMGPEMEKHIITQSNMVYIPPGFVHCPWLIKRVDRPFLFIEVNQGPMHTEKSYPQLVPEKDRAMMLFSDEGYGEGTKVVLPKGLSIDLKNFLSKKE
jgi:hypothetical protein